MLGERHTCLPLLSLNLCTKKAANEIWEDEDILKAFPQTGGEQPGKLTAHEQGNGLETKPSVTPGQQTVHLRSFYQAYVNPQFFWCLLNKVTASRLFPQRV